jgi:hypothetical protein
VRQVQAECGSGLTRSSTFHVADRPSLRRPAPGFIMTDVEAAIFVRARSTCTECPDCCFLMILNPLNSEQIIFGPACGPQCNSMPRLTDANGVVSLSALKASGTLLGPAATLPHRGASAGAGSLYTVLRRDRLCSGWTLKP